jgi:hypothetical protein
MNDFKTSGEFRAAPKCLQNRLMNLDIIEGFPSLAYALGGFRLRAYRDETMWTVSR